MTRPAPAGRLLARLPNWLGDVAIILPVLEALERAGFDVVLAGRSWCADLLAAYPMTRFATCRSHLRTGRQLRGAGALNGVLFVRSIGSALEMRLAGVRAVGYRAELRRPLLYRSMRKRRGDHILEYYRRIARFACEVFGGNVSAFDSTLFKPVLRLTSGHREQARKALAAAGISPPFQVWCPLAAHKIHGASKIWPRYAELCDRVLAAGERVVSCPAPGEEEQVRAALPGAHILPGLGLGALAGVLEQSELVLANDTGPAHVAAALGVETVALFGPGGNPGRTGPVGATILGGADGWPAVDTVFEEIMR